MIDYRTVSLAAVLFGGAFALYTYFGYPLVLRVLGAGKKGIRASVGEDWDWPSVSISVPAYNEEAQIEGLLESLLELDYPKDRLQILVVSDASSDRTDEIVKGFADRGVELHRVSERGGKTRAEAAAAEFLRGDIVLNTDASIRIAPGSLRPLISTFQDPGIGLASGRDISVDPGEYKGNVGETGYVGYEMGIRDLETRLSGIVGASGCFYAIRKDLHRLPLPNHLSRDFASALLTRNQGLRAVSVPDAICFVPRTGSLKKEYRRKVRTIARGIDTLLHLKALLNPARFGVFSWMLFSHKVCRWALPWFGIAVWLALAALAFTEPWALALFALGGLVLGLAGIGWVRSEDPSLGPVFSMPAYLVAGNLAAARAFVQVLTGDQNALWEPTRRESVQTPSKDANEI